MKIYVFSFLFFLGCSAGIRPVNCPYPQEEFQSAVDVFVSHYPEGDVVLNRTDVFCTPEPYIEDRWGKYAGVADWPGSNMARARMRLATGGFPTVASGGTIHEFLHLYKWDVVDDPCYLHTEDCWDEEAISDMRKELGYE